MHEFTTPAAPPQAPAAPPHNAYPKVSYRLLARRQVELSARRRRVPAAEAIAACDATFAATRGNHYAAQRAGWAAVDAQRIGMAGEG